MKLLVIDVGGTYLRAALSEGEEKKKQIKIAVAPFRFFEEWYNQSEFKDKKLDRVVIAAAGPCDGKSLPMTNFPWVFEKEKLEKLFDCEVLLLNDLEGAVYLLPFLELPEIPKGGVKGLIVPGTGLGEGFIVPFHDGWLPMPSEARHTYFVPQTKRQKELVDKSASFPLELETFLSGGGLKRIHFLLTGEHLTPEEVAIENGEAVDLFAEILIDEAVNFALRTLPRGGLFLGGSIVQTIAPTIKQHAKRFLNHPRMGHVLSDIPLAILSDEEITLQGATLFGLYQK